MNPSTDSAEVDDGTSKSADLMDVRNTREKKGCYTHSSGATIVARIMGSMILSTLSSSAGSGKSAGLSMVRSVPFL